MEPNYILEALSERIRTDLDKVFEEEKLRVIDRLEQEKIKTIAACMLSLSKQLDIQRQSDMIILRIEKK